MAEDKKEATSKEKKTGKEAAPAAAPAANAGGGLPMGAIAAGVVLLLLGGGMGVGGSMVMAKWAGGAEAKADAGAHTAAPAEGEHGKSKEKTLHEMTEISIGDLMSNIRNQQGRRFVKVSCAIYMVTEDAVKLGLSAAGGGHGGGEAGGNIKRILQQSLEEHLKNYDMDDLTGPNIYLQLKKGFRDALERTLHDTFPHEASDKRFVERVVLTNLLVQ